MKHITALIMILCFAQSGWSQEDDYEQLWKEVTQKERLGQPKSALEIVTRISEKAQSSSNHNQIIKSLLYKSKYALTLEEDAQLNIINDFKAQIETATFPSKNILENMLAHLYWQYYQSNRWQFLERTETASKVDSTDFRTWDLKTLYKEIDQYFTQSIEEGLMLQQEKLSRFNTLIVPFAHSKTFRPTLYDFLVHQALDFYKTDDFTLSSPAYRFEVDNPKYLADIQVFTNLDIQSKDSQSQDLKALKLYQRLLKFHRKQGDLALAHINLERLTFVQKRATFSNSNNLLIEALDSALKQSYTPEALAMYKARKATLLWSDGRKYHPENNPDARWKLKEALALCDDVINTLKKGYAYDECKDLKHQILKRGASLKTESNVPVQRPSKLLLRYKNIKQLNFSVYKVSIEQLRVLDELYREDQQKAWIQKLNAQHQWSTELIDTSDYQFHSVEIPIPSLEQGLYIITATTPHIAQVWAFNQFQVTNLALIEKNTPNANVYQVIDRNTGTLINNATVAFNYITSTHEASKSETSQTDANGEVLLKKGREAWYTVKVHITKGDSEGYFGDYYKNRRYKQDDQKPRKHLQNFSFTDRSIYRPGQTVYFKGIVLERFKDETTVSEDTKLTVALHNVNGEKVSELEFSTNDFGSYHGQFVLPTTGLTGTYSLRVKGPKHLRTSLEYFKVEDYKRPKFETSIDPVTETIQVNDTVPLRGKALAYAGTPITDAKVVYRVERKVQYPRWYYWYRPWIESSPQEITHGETTTDAFGAFSIPFKALPDTSVEKENLPVFQYEVSVDVTDVNGETRSATSTVNVGYHTLTAQLTIADKLDKTSKKNSLEIRTKNLNNEFVAAKGHIQIYKLQAPKDVLRPRPWHAPDYKLQTEEEFKTLFPHEAYDKEDHVHFWKKGRLVLDEAFDTDISKTVVLGNMRRWVSGLYVVELNTQDRYGQKIVEKAYVTVFSPKDTTEADQQLLNITTDKSSYTPGETVHMTFGSNLPALTIFVEVEKEGQIISKETIALNNNKYTLKIPVTQEDEGGFIVHYTAAGLNHYLGSSKQISVPYPSTDLEIETTTFRDKLQPGSDETWSFKIKGPKGEQVSAELLASMYDASLDQFNKHEWSFIPIRHDSYYKQYHINPHNVFGISNFNVFINDPYKPQNTTLLFDRFNWYGLSFNSYNSSIYRESEVSFSYEQAPTDTFLRAQNKKVLGFASAAPGVEIQTDSVKYRDGDYKFSRNYNEIDSDESQNAPSKQQDFSEISIRKNLQETAFFFPQLQTDEAGNVSFSFTTPEALTQWKLQLLAHTKTLESATMPLEAVTQKELMVTPNAPRFLREGDRITISSKITSLSETMLTGQAKLELYDAISGNVIDTELQNTENVVNFKVAPKGNTQVSWTLEIPDFVQAVQYKVLAKAGTFSDGEQNVLPVLSNRMLVTETLPLWVGSNQTKTFTLDKLKNQKSSTLKHHQLTLELTSNPAWYALQSLPYLMEYPYECNEQIFSRYYANSMATHVVNSQPKIKAIFDQWRAQGSLESPLEKNPELKSILIEETPWLRDAQSEAEQQQRIALLFDLNNMRHERETALNKLSRNQLNSGGWPWFKGGRANRYITQHIISSFGHLKQLGVSKDEKAQQMVQKAMQYLDAKFVHEYKDIRKYNADVDLSKDHLSHTQLHYLYMRSFFPEIEMSQETKEVKDYYLGQIKKYWLSRSLYSKGLMALIMDRMQNESTAQLILKSLKETSIYSEELGRYWKANTASWYWYQAPIETQALLIEAFAEIENDTETVDALKVWLLKNKQTNRWETTKATTEAVYALLLQGSDWLSTDHNVQVTIGNHTINPSEDSKNAQAGSGYYKTQWNGSEITADMGTISMSKKGKGIAWGGVYWQYFEDLDNISSSETGLELKKQLFRRNYTDSGELLTPISKDTSLKVGDLVRVRIELRSDRDLEFVHMKDMRASGLEPVNVLSRYKWQDGLGYYESTRDAATNFFFDRLPKGVYVFEYDLRVNNAGNMSNGITSIQCMYAPEFSSHSKGAKLNVE